MAGELLNFTISSHALTFYGKCNKIAQNGICENKNQAE
jgi:hypothetical protein